MSFEEKIQQPYFHEPPLFHFNQRIQSFPVSQATNDDLLSIPDYTSDQFSDQFINTRNHSEPLIFHSSSSSLGRSLSDLPVRAISTSFRREPRRDSGFKSFMSHAFSSLHQGEKPPSLRPSKRPQFHEFVEYDDVDEYGFHERSNEKVDFERQENVAILIDVAKALYEEFLKRRIMSKLQIIAFVDSEMNAINKERGSNAIPKNVYHDMLREYFSRLASELRDKDIAMLKSYRLSAGKEALMNFFASCFK